MSARSYWIAIVLLCVVVFSWSLYRDVLAEKQYTGDLRNRVVGARMQKDGLSPYFYKWKKADGYRYYDPDNFDSLKVSNITASPFFHRLLYPVAGLPQRTISIYWLLAEYAMLVFIVMMAFSLAVTLQQKWLVLILTCLFLLTEAWKMHTANGQNYICIPFLAFVFYYSICKKQTLLMAFVAGLAAMALILIKPNAVLFFIPFLIRIKKYNKPWLTILLLPIIIAAAWILSAGTERMRWMQYKENIVQQVRLHQQLSPVLQNNEPDPGFELWEGIDKKEISKQAQLHPMHIYSENGNFFVMAQLILHKKLSTAVLAVICGCSVVLLLAIFYKMHYKDGFNLHAITLTGFCLFMLADLFSPVYRHQYYAVQWIFPLLLCASFYQSAQKKWYMLMGAGLVLNVVNLAFMPMEHSMGEYIMLLAFIVLSLRRETESIQ